MSAYIIDFSEPLEPGFSIPAGGFNGPGGTTASTTLRLYGRGALEWGESVNEDLVRITENFASASSPSRAISGQTWVERTLYCRNTSIINVLQGWYFYDLAETATNKWKLVNGTGTVAASPSLSPTVGEYYYWDGIASPTRTEGPGLYGFYSLGRYEPSAWRKRSNITSVGVPTSPAILPAQYFRTYDKATNAWSTPVAINLTTGVPPSPPAIGMLWYNTTTGSLQVYTANGWQTILGPTLVPSVPTVSSGNIDMNGYLVTNLGGPVNPNDATRKSYVDAAIAGAGSGTFLRLAGPAQTVSSLVTFSGLTTLSGGVAATTVNASTSISSPTLSISGTSTLSVLNVTTSASMSGVLSMNSNKVTNMATGTNAQDGVNVSQLNAAIAAAGVGTTTPNIYTSGTYKAGDIAIALGKIYIALGAGSGVPPGGNWKQVFPAVYS